MSGTSGSAASSVDEPIPPGERVLLDTSGLLAHLARNESVSVVASQVVNGLVGTGRNDAVISTVTVSELLHRPLSIGREAVDRMVSFLDSLEALQVRSVDSLVAAEAARIRVLTRIPLADAMVIATAVLTSCAVLVTNDRLMAAAARQAVPELRVVLLSEVAAV